MNVRTTRMPVIDTLSNLANQIAALRTFGENCGEDRVRTVARQLADKLTHFLDDVVEDPKMLVGDMVWPKPNAD